MVSFSAQLFRTQNFQTLLVITHSQYLITARMAETEHLKQQCYQYTPLTSQLRTRVLILEPALHSSIPLCGQLSEISLDSSSDCVPYEALSYTWGGQQPCLPLRLSDCKELLITPNADAALRRLRLRSKQYVIWVDSICINQANLEEKGNQVSIMRMIYHKSERVIVWLGDSTREIDLAMRALRISPLLSLGVFAKSTMFLNRLLLRGEWPLAKVKIARPVKLCSNPLLYLKAEQREGSDKYSISLIGRAYGPFKSLRPIPASRLYTVARSSQSIYGCWQVPLWHCHLPSSHIPMNGCAQ